MQRLSSQALRASKFSNTGATCHNRCVVTELSLEDEVIDHDLEAHVHVPSLTFFGLVDSRLHVVVDAPLRYTTKHPECMVIRVEEHFVGLQWVCLQQ
ncbi:MAG: hypothetical protein RL541_975 [Pseudomonadota bacterium]